MVDAEVLGTCAMTSRRKCLFCGGKADLLCDSWIGWERKRDAPGGLNVVKLPGYRVPTKYRVIHTCDAPLCRACATRAGFMHVRMRGGSFSDTTDYCPGHGRGDLSCEITGLQAEAWRARWRSTVRQSVAQPDQQDLFGAAP